MTKCALCGTVGEAAHVCPWRGNLVGLVEVQSTIATTEFIRIACAGHVATTSSIQRRATAVAERIVAD